MNLDRLRARLMATLGLGRTTMAPVDSGPVQTVQLQFSSAELRDAMPVLYGFGFSSSPPAGADALAVFLEGDRSKGVIIAMGHQVYRLKGLAPGQAALYDQAGSKVVLTNDANITLVPATGGKTIVQSDLQVQGKVTATGDVLAGTISVQQHTHPYLPGTGSQTETGIAQG